MDLTLLLMKTRNQMDTSPSLCTCAFPNRGDDCDDGHGDDGLPLHPLHLLCNRVVSMSQNF